MARDVGAGRVRDETQVLMSEEVSISLEPNSRFMNELLVIWPTQPAGSPRLARAKNCAMNGTVIAYVPLQTFAYLER